MATDNAQVRTMAKQNASVERPMRMTGMESLVVAQGGMFHMEMARAGKRYIGGCSAIASAIAPVQALPTTSPTIALQNTASAGGKSLVIDFLSVALTSGTGAAGLTVYAGLSNGAVTLVAASAGHSIVSSSGSANASVGRFGAVTTMPAGTAYLPVLNSLQTAAVITGGGPGVNLWGGVVVPPGFALGLCVFSGAGTSPLYSLTLAWDEVVLDLE